MVVWARVIVVMDQMEGMRKREELKDESKVLGCRAEDWSCHLPITTGL